MEVSGTGRDNIRPTLTSFFSLTRNYLDRGESWILGTTHWDRFNGRAGLAGMEMNLFYRLPW